MKSASITRVRVTIHLLNSPLLLNFLKNMDIAARTLDFKASSPPGLFRYSSTLSQPGGRARFGGNDKPHMSETGPLLPIAP
jgi:hypothetical protein